MDRQANLRLLRAIKADDPTGLAEFDASVLQNLNTRGFGDKTPFGYAIRNGLNRVVEYMIMRGDLDLNAPASTAYMDNTPIELAATSENMLAFNLLLAHGAIINGALFKTVFGAIRARKSPELKEMLHTILNTAGFVIPERRAGKSYLYEALESDLDDDTIQLLVQAGAQSAPTNLNIQPKANNFVLKSIGNVKKRTVAEEEFGATLYVNEAFLDIQLLRNQTAYIRSLNTLDKTILVAYTYLGDTFLNAFLRGMFDAPKFLEGMRHEPLTGAFHTYILMRRGLGLESVRRSEFMEDLERNHVAYLEAYRDDLLRVITAAPRPTHAIKIFRGIKRPGYMLSELEKSHTFETSDFQSTSLSDTSAINFATYNDNGDTKYGAVMEILLPAGTPCLCMEPLSKFEREMEILLPMGLNFKHERTLTKLVEARSWAGGTFEIQVIEMRGVSVSETGV